VVDIAMPLSMAAARTAHVVAQVAVMIRITLFVEERDATGQ